MWDPEQDEIDRLLSDWYFGTPGPDWLEDMIGHYQRSGFWRPEDFSRLFGDINQGVTIDPDDSLEDILKAALERRQT